MYLYLVSGLLLSYRFSSAMGKWDEGKQVWSGVRTTIRDGIRMVSFAIFCLRESLKQCYSYLHSLMERTDSYL